MSTTAPEVRVIRAHSAQFDGMADHLGHARILADMGMLTAALAEMELVQAQLRHLARVEKIVEATEEVPTSSRPSVAAVAAAKLRVSLLEKEGEPIPAWLADLAAYDAFQGVRS
jgi:hypothetical protein